MGGVDETKLIRGEASQDPLVGPVLGGRYRLVRKLATAHTGAVYLAREIGTENRVAVKVLHAKYAQDEKGVKGFRRLMLALAFLSKRHRNLVRVYGCDRTEDGRLFIAMEYLEGTPLSDLMRQAGTLEITRALRLALQMAEGLGVTHDAGIVHADIQPQNFLVLGKAEALKLIGFERARLESVGPMDPLLDTRGIPRAPEYLAPEQIEEGQISPQTDIYALGVVLYRMLTGVVPFRAATPEAVRAMHLHTAPTPLRVLRPEVPFVVEAKVLQALQKDPKWRGNHVRDVVSEVLQELAAERARGKGDPIRGLRTALQAGKDRARSIGTKYGTARWGWKLAVIISLLILVAVPLWWMASSRKAPEVSSVQSPNQSPDTAPRSEPASAHEPDWKANEVPLLPSQDSQGRTSPEPSPPESASQGAGKPAEEKSTPAPTRRMAESPPNARFLGAPRREGADTRAPDTQAPKTKAETHGGPPDPTAVIDWLLKHREAVRH
jgi:serine/threonine protein kinase